MLTAPSTKSDASTDDTIARGLKKIDEKKYPEAIELFQSALKEMGEATSQILFKHFDKAYAQKHYKACQVFGTVLKETEIESYVFLNQLGNCERKLKNYPQANQCYKSALKLKQDYILARQNLAAGIAKVEKYDTDVAHSIATVSSYTSLLIPDHLPNKNISKRKNVLNLLLTLKKEKEHQLLGALLDEKKKLMEKGATEDIRGITGRIKSHLQLEDSTSISKDEFQKLLREIIEERWEVLSPSEQQDLAVETYNLGLVYLKKEKGEKASALFLKLLNQNCKFYYLEMLMGLADYLQFHKDSSLGELKSFFTQEPGNRYVNINLGIIYRELNNHLRSDTHFLLAAKRFEELEGLINSKEIYHRGEELHAQEMDEKALVFYKAAYKELGNLKILNHIGKIYLESEQYSDALQTFKEILLVDPDYQPAIQTLERISEICKVVGREKMQGEDPTEALQYFKLSKEAYRDPEVLKLMSVCYRKLKDKQMASQLDIEYKALLEKLEKEELDELFFRLTEGGKKAMKDKKFDKSIKCFEKALTLKVDKNVFVFLAHIYKTLNRVTALRTLVSNYKNRIK